MAVFILVGLVAGEVAKEDTGHCVLLVGGDEAGTHFMDWGCVNVRVDLEAEGFEVCGECGYVCHWGKVTRFRRLSSYLSIEILK